MSRTTLLLFVLVIIGGGWYFFKDDGYEIRNSDPKGSTIVCFGDNLTYGTGASEKMDYPSRLSKMIGEPVINAGVPGDTTGSALKRLEADVLEEAPRIVLMTLAGNDLKNGVSKEVAFENLRQITETIQAGGALVVLGGLNFPVGGRGYGTAYVEFAKKYGVVLIPNILDGLLGHPDLMSDQVHPNDAGYGIVAQKFYDAVKPYLK